MPNLLAHSLIAKRLYNHETEANKTTSNRAFLKGNYDFLVLGSLGPDPLFYTGILPFHGLHLKTALLKVGNKLHQMDAKTLFRVLIEETYFIEDAVEKSRFEAFILGQFAHYVLDREAHPYILYESGFDQDGKITKHYHYDHAFFEANIDLVLSEKYNILRFSEYPEEVIPNNKVYLKFLDLYFVPALLKTTKIKKLPKKMYSNAIGNYRRLLKSMKKGRIKAKLLGKSSALGAMYMPKKGIYSTINEEKKTWLDPTTGSKHNDSFMEISSRSYGIVLSCYHDILRYGFNFEVFNKYLDGRNYYGEKIGAKRIYKREDQ